MNEAKTVMSFKQKFFDLQSKLDVLKRDAENPFHKSKYLPLPTILRETKPLFQELRLLAYHVIEDDIVKFVLEDLDGPEKRESWIRLVNIPDMQKIGSGITYARRYTISAMLEIEEEDDDGNSASNVSTKTIKSAAPSVTVSASGDINPNDWELKEGTSKASGKPWKGYFHKTNKELKYWSSDPMFAQISSLKNK